MASVLTLLTVDNNQPTAKNRHIGIKCNSYFKHTKAEIWFGDIMKKMSINRPKCMPTGGCVVSEIFVRFAEEDKWQIICASSSPPWFSFATHGKGEDCGGKVAMN